MAVELQDDFVRPKPPYGWSHCGGPPRPGVAIRSGAFSSSERAVRYSDASAPSGDSSSDNGMFAAPLSKTPHTPEPMWRASNRMLIMVGGGE